MRLTIELSDDEKTLAENYAKSHELSLDEAFKRPFLKRLKMNMMLP